MKRIFRNALALLLIFTLSACSSAPVAPLQSAMNQIGKPILDAYEAMGLPGEPIDASRGDILLLAIDGVELCGRSGAVVLSVSGNTKASDNAPVGRVEYNFPLENPTEAEGQFALDLYDYIVDELGEPVGSDLYQDDFLGASAASLLTFEPNEGGARAQWNVPNDLCVYLSAARVAAENTTSGEDTFFVSIAVHVDPNVKFK